MYRNTCLIDNPVILGDEKKRINNLNHTCILCVCKNVLSFKIWA